MITLTCWWLYEPYSEEKDRLQTELDEELIELGYMDECGNLVNCSTTIGYTN